MGPIEWPLEEKAVFFVFGKVAELVEAAMCLEDRPDKFNDLCGHKDNDHLVRIADFMGKVSTIFPDMTKSPIDLDMESGPLVFIPCRAKPDLFEAPYACKETLRKEFEETLKSKGVFMPKDFDWWRYIVSINGTYFC